MVTEINAYATTDPPPPHPRSAPKGVYPPLLAKKMKKRIISVEIGHFTH